MTSCRLIKMLGGSAVVAVVLATGSAVMATGSGATLNWAFQDTGFTSSFSGSALGMRNGGAFPVIFDNDSTVRAYTLLPVNNPFSGTNWHEIGNGLFSSSGGPIRASSSSAGSVAVSNDMNSAVSTPPGGSFVSLPGIGATTFDSGGNLVTATFDTVSAAIGFPDSGIHDIAVSDFGNVAAISSGTGFGDYYQFSPITGVWGQATLPTSFEASRGSVTFDTNDVPHIVSTDGAEVQALDFDATTGQWVSTILDNNASFSQVISIAADSTGTVGTAWVDNDGVLHHAYKSGLDPWATTAVTSDVVSGSVGIAYDYNDFPVIAYTDSPTGNLFLAYDPPVTLQSPEPATLAFVVLAGGALLPRRSRARCV